MHKLEQIVGSKYFTQDAKKLDEASTSWREGKGSLPFAILSPSNTNQVALIIEYCNKFNIGIVTQGGKTSLTKASVPAKSSSQKKQIILKTERLNSISKPCLNTNVVSVGCGVTLEKLQASLKPYNLMLPLGLGIGGIAQLGGNVATNAGGLEVFKYGRTANLIDSIKVVTPAKFGSKNTHVFTEQNPGRNIVNDFIGSEGCFGIITEITFKLIPLRDNKKQETLLLSFSKLSNLSIAKEQIRQSLGEDLIALERVDKASYFLAENYLKTNNNIATKIDKYNLIILANTSLKKVQKLCQKLVIQSLLCNNKQQSEIWQIRNINISASIKDKAKKFSLENLSFDLSLPKTSKASFPSSKLIKALKRLDKNIEYYGFGHEANNGLHFNLLFKNRPLTKEIKSLVYNEILDLGGSISAEHGVGFAKKMEFKKYYPAEYASFVALKKLYDPKGIMNPSKVI